MAELSRSPIIVIGMHRSGTSLVSRMLDTLGVFMGARVDNNHEALFFLRLNGWLMRQAGGSWDQPAPVDLMLAQEELMALNRAYIEYVLGSPRSVVYLSARRYLLGDRIGRLDGHWGWKDPRNTFTLPLWLSIYPDARVINVMRHGVDVAHSLQVRYERRLKDAAAQFERRRWVYGWYEKRRGFAESVRTATLDGAFGLWRDYVRRADEHVAALGDRMLTVRFEELATQPREELERIASFVGLSPERAALEAAAGQPSPERAFAFRRSPALVAFSERIGSELGRYSA